MHRLSGDHRPNRRDVDEDIQITWNENEGHCEMKENREEEFIVPHCIGCSADPVGDLKKWQANAEAEIMNDLNHKDSARSGSTGTGSFVTTDSIVANDEECAGQDVLTTVLESDDNQEILSNESMAQSSSLTKSRKAVGGGDEAEIKEAKRDIVFRAPVNSQLSSTEEKKKLVRMGLTTAVAISTCQCNGSVFTPSSV